MIFMEDGDNLDDGHAKLLAYPNILCFLSEHIQPLVSRKPGREVFDLNTATKMPPTSCRKWGKKL
jgi:hypothetical protein